MLYVVKHKPTDKFIYFDELMGPALVNLSVATIHNNEDSDQSFEDILEWLHGQWDYLNEEGSLSKPTIFKKEDIEFYEVEINLKGLIEV